MYEPLPDYRIDPPEEPEFDFDELQAQRERWGDVAYDQWVMEQLEDER